DAKQDIETAAIEANAQNVEPLEGTEVPEGQIGARFLCERTDLDVVSKYLAGAKWKVQASEMRYIAKNFLELSPDQRKEVSDFLTSLDDHDDVHHIFAAIR